MWHSLVRIIYTYREPRTIHLRMPFVNVMPWLLSHIVYMILPNIQYPGQLVANSHKSSSKLSVLKSLKSMKFRHIRSIVLLVRPVFVRTLLYRLTKNNGSQFCLFLSFTQLYYLFDHLRFTFLY